MCNLTHCESYGLELIAVTEVRKHLVYIPEDMIVSFYLWIYDILCDYGSLDSKLVSSNASPLMLLLIA